MNEIAKVSSDTLKNDKAVLIYFEKIINTIREPLIVLDINIHILYINQSFYSTFKLIPEKKLENLFTK